MKRVPMLVLALIGMTCGMSVTAAAAQSRARITFLTSKVSPGGVLTLRATDATRGTSCTARLGSPDDVDLRLPTRRTTTRKLHWQYRMPDDSQVGNWFAYVSCGLSGPDIKTFGVVSSTPAAQVGVAADGFTQSNYSSSSETFISYGVVLQNKSSNVDALGLTVNVSFVDTLGRSVTTNQTTLTGIPAGSDFYLGGLASSNVSLTVASMDVTVTALSSQPRRLVLPPVSEVSTQSDGFGDSVSGTFANPYQVAIPSTAEIYVVYLDPQGNVVGGASEFAGAAVQPGQLVAFGFSGDGSTINPSFVQPSAVSTVQASVDPCVGDYSCPAQVPAPN